jgi:hypothetical protein
MLPGFRFLLAAIVLSMSILIFGLGAAALLRAAHEEVASVPTRRVMPEPVFAQQVEPPAPTLALLRVEPAAPEKAQDTPPAATPLPEPALEAAPVPKVEAENLAALKLDDVASGDTARPELAAALEVAVKPETATTELPAVPPAAEPAAATETKIAAIDVAPSPLAEAPPAPETIAPPAMMDPGIAAEKTAALGSPAAKVEKPAEAKKASEKPDREEIRKQERAQRAKERRRQAARRAKLAAQQAAAAQQATDPFSLMTQQVQPAQPATTTTRRR